MQDKKRKQLRVILPPSQGVSFERHKAETERRILVSLTDSQFSRMLISQALNTLDKLEGES